MDCDRWRLNVPMKPVNIWCLLVCSHMDLLLPQGVGATSTTVGTRSRAGANTKEGLWSQDHAICIFFVPQETTPQYCRRCVLIPQVRPAHKYSISPWEMIHPPGEIMQYVCKLTRFTRMCVTSHSQPIINAKHKIPSNKLLVKNN
jgi:hypothetical protein